MFVCLRARVCLCLCVFLCVGVFLPNSHITGLHITFPWFFTNCGNNCLRALFEQSHSRSWAAEVNISTAVTVVSMMLEVKHKLTITAMLILPHIISLRHDVSLTS